MNHFFISILVLFALYNCHFVLANENGEKVNEISQQETGDSARKEVEIFILPNGGNNSDSDRGFWFSVKRENRASILEEIKKLAISMVLNSISHRPRDVDLFDIYGRVVENPAEFKHMQILLIVPKSDFFIWPGKKKCKMEF